MFQLLGGYFPINDQIQWLSKKESKQIDSINNSIEKLNQFEKIISNKIVKGTIVNLATLPYYLDSGFKRVLNKALSFQYDKRYKNTSLFLKDIHHLQRNCPDYIVESERLFIVHDGGKKYQIYQNQKKEIVLEKSSTNGVWRKDNSHDGSIKSALSIARIK